MCFDDDNFIPPPNFKYKETISNESDCLSNSNTFDLYKTSNNDIILITPVIDPINFNNEDFFINIINLTNNKILKKLSGHKERILSLKIFSNKKTKNDFLISVDKGHNVFVWDIQNNFEKIFEIKFDYEINSFIYNTLIIFGETNTWIIASSISEKNKTFVVDMNKKENVVEISESENIPVYCLLYWYNSNQEEEKDRHNIIQCGKNRILISQFPSNKTYYSFNDDDIEPIKYYSGGIVYKINDKDFLAISACSGIILIFDLAEKKFEKKIEIKGVHLFSFIKWNENYLMVMDTRNKKIIIMDMINNYKIVSRNYLPELGIGAFMKKLIHPLYGESILISGKDWTIKLFTLKNVTKIVDDDD